MCYVLIYKHICNVQGGIYREGCIFAMCSYTPAMCNVLWALCCVQRGIYCAGAASEIDFAIIFNDVITSGYLLDAQQQMDIVKKWNLPMMAAGFFSFEVDAINLNQLFVLDCSYHNLERGKQQMLKGIFWWILVLTSAKINGAERERNCVRVPDPRPV